MTIDDVNYPKHYTSDPSGVEAITICEHRSFCMGNAIKYLFRAGRKGDKDKHIEDLRKAVWYIEREIALLVTEEPIATDLDELDLDEPIPYGVTPEAESYYDKWPASFWKTRTP